MEVVIIDSAINPPQLSLLFHDAGNSSSSLRSPRTFDAPVSEGVRRWRAWWRLFGNTNRYSTVFSSSLIRTPQYFVQTRYLLPGLENEPRFQHFEKCILGKMREASLFAHLKQKSQMIALFYYLGYKILIVFWGAVRVLLED